MFRIFAVMILQKHKEREIGKLYKSYYTKLFFCAYDIIGDEEWAKDIVGEAFGNLWNDYDKLHSQDLRSYLFVAVRNRSIDFMRRQQSVRNYRRVLLDTEQEWYEENPYERDEQIRLVQRIIRELPPKQHHIFSECYLKGRKYRELAEELGLSEASIHKYMVKAFATIREKFKKSE